MGRGSFPENMANVELLENPREANFPQEPQLNLLLKDEALDDPLYRRLFRGLDEFFFPKKLPPLVLTSRPVPVRDIWGFYNYKRRGALGSTVLHMIAIAAIIGGALVARRVVEVVKPKETVQLIAPDSIPTLKPSKTLSGGGGGGGDHDKLQATKGR